MSARSDEVYFGLRCAVCEELFGPGEQVLRSSLTGENAHPWDDEVGACVAGGLAVVPMNIESTNLECRHCRRRLEESAPGFLDVVDTSYLCPAQGLGGDFPEGAQWHEPRVVTGTAGSARR